MITDDIPGTDSVHYVAEDNIAAARLATVSRSATTRSPYRPTASFAAMCHLRVYGGGAAGLLGGSRVVAGDDSAAVTLGTTAVRSISRA